MRLEGELERWAVKRLREVHANPLKMGQDGMPDRLVLWGKGLHFWIEFKQHAKSKIRPGQKLFAKYSIRIGDQNYLVFSREQLEEIISSWKDVYGPANASRLPPVSTAGR